MSGTAHDCHSYNRGFAIEAGLALAAINAEEFLEIAGIAAGIAIIAQCAAAGFDGGFQNLAYGFY